MRPRFIALLFSLLLVCAIPASFTIAQTGAEQKKEEKESAQDVKKFAVKLFEIRYRHPESLANALFALGSGTPGSTMQPNTSLGTLTVRDFPENIAAIEEALKRLDVPDKSPVSLEFQLHLIAASMTPSEKTTLPKNLEAVVEQLKSTLKFTNYRYVNSALNRVSDRGKIDSSGVTSSLFPTIGVVNAPDNPSYYQYSLSRVSLTQDATGKESIQIDSFRFSVSVPVKVAGGYQYKDIGITTPLSLREAEIAVVGTANISGSDEAIIVAISVKKAK
jgi:Bacterial type II/III secretion system short domain